MNILRFKIVYNIINIVFNIGIIGNYNWISYYLW